LNDNSEETITSKGNLNGEEIRKGSLKGQKEKPVIRGVNTVRRKEKAMRKENEKMRQPSRRTKRVSKSYSYG